MVRSENQAEDHGNIVYAAAKVLIKQTLAMASPFSLAATVDCCTASSDTAHVETFYMIKLIFNYHKNFSSKSYAYDMARYMLSVFHK
ncbi:hypothetical protein LRN48_14685, partial [Staphylococcus aureus]|nr:hypothetical protein [Staphylococcus aureus]